MLKILGGFILLVSSGCASLDGTVSVDTSSGTPVISFDLNQEVSALYVSCVDDAEKDLFEDGEMAWYIEANVSTDGLSGPITYGEVPEDANVINEALDLTTFTSCDASACWYKSGSTTVCRFSDAFSTDGLDPLEAGD